VAIKGSTMKLKFVLAITAATFAVPAYIGVARPVATATQSAHDRLFKLFKDSDEASLKRNPINGLFRGDLRYADHLGDSITDQS
jgi:hypothetical protein